MGNISLGDDCLPSGLSMISFVRAEILLNRILSSHNNLVHHLFQLRDIMSVSPGYDYRQRVATPDNKDMPLAPPFFPCPSDFG